MYQQDNAKFRYPQTDDADDAKNSKPLFRVGFLFIFHGAENKFYRQDPIHHQSRAKAKRRGDNLGNDIPYTTAKGCR